MSCIELSSEPPSYEPPSYEPPSYEPPSYESHYFTEGQQIRHVIHTSNTISTWVGIWISTFSKSGVLYKGRILSLNDFAKSHKLNIINWKECDVDGWKECEVGNKCEVDGKWIYKEIMKIY